VIVYPLSKREDRVLGHLRRWVPTVSVIIVVALLLFQAGCCTLCLRRVADEVRRHTERPPTPNYVAEAK